MSFEGMTKREALAAWQAALAESMARGNRIAELERLTELDGATFVPEEGAQVSNAGEFAAYWNSLTPERRELMVVAMRDSASAALKCFIENHENRIPELEGRITAIREGRDA